MHHKFALLKEKEEYMICYVIIIFRLYVSHLLISLDIPSRTICSIFIHIDIEVHAYKCIVDVFFNINSINIISFSLTTKFDHKFSINEDTNTNPRLSPTMCFQFQPPFPPTRSLDSSRNQQNKLHRQEISSRQPQRSHISLPRSRRTKQEPRPPVAILQETTTTTTSSLTRSGSSRWPDPRAHRRSNH